MLTKSQNEELSFLKCNHYRLKTVKPVFALMLLAYSLLAQAAGSTTPGAGTILQQINPVEPPAPSSTGTGLNIEQGNGAELPPSVPFLVKTIRISGNALFDGVTLHALVVDAEGKSFTLSQLNELAARITDYYHNHGYPLARAIIPAQTINDGAVMIEVIEARFGKINLNNHSRVNDSLLLSTLSTLQSGQPINQAMLDQSLLLLSDIPGIVTSATLKPGQAVGTSDLVVEAAPGSSVSGNVALDDYGNRYTGRAHAGGTVNFINPLRHGDVLNVNGLSSGSGMNYGRISYESIMNGQGTRMGGSYSALHYILGDSFSSLNGHGTADVESLWVKHPIVRSRDVNLYGQIQFDKKNLMDHIDAIGIRSDRGIYNWTGSLSGDGRDTLLSGGINTWNLGLTSGRVGFDDAMAQLADSMTARTQGSFKKWNASLGRLQSLSQGNRLYLTFSGQRANSNLDSSEKMIAGGPYTVRAYAMGAVSGDTGYLGTAEFRHDLDQTGYGQWQAIGFIDSEHVTVNKTVWAAGANDATLRGVGLGLNWAGQNQWIAKAHIAKRVGTAPVLVADAPSVRAWIEIDKGF